MLQQTQVKTVIPYWRRWMRALPTLSALARARSERLHKLWEGLGYYSRARNLQKAARLVLRVHAGKFPDDFDAILALPGVGRYTAGAICSIAFNQPKAVLDGNVVRVLCRAFAIDGDPRESSTRARLWELAEQLVIMAGAGFPTRKQKPGATNGPALESQNSPYVPRCSWLNQSLMELGATICVSRKPRCTICPIVNCCAAHRAGRVGQLPRRIPRNPPTQRRFAALILEDRGRFLVRQRPAGIINGQLWEFPNIEIGPGQSDIRKCLSARLGIRPKHLERIGWFKHSITRFRITLEVFHGVGDGPLSSAAGRWLNVAQLRKLALPSAHKRILQELLPRKISRR